MSIIFTVYVYRSFSRDDGLVDFCPFLLIPSCPYLFTLLFLHSGPLVFIFVFLIIGNIKNIENLENNGNLKYGSLRKADWRQ